MAQEGWICPRCGKVHAPWVPACECSTSTIKRSKNGTYDENWSTMTEISTSTSSDEKMICS